MGDIDPVTTGELSATSPSDPSSHRRVINVLVTGFGPFKHNPVNASFLIASSLPSSITLPRKDNPTHQNQDGVTPYEIFIHTHPTAVPVAYAKVGSLVPEILKEFADRNNGTYPDLIVHMGIASTRGYYTVETQAHRDQYQMPDIDGKVDYESEKLWREQGLPEILRPGPSEESDPEIIQISSSPKIIPYPPNEHFLQIWKSLAPQGADIRISYDAGRYLCEFIFFTSMALAHQAGRERAVIFYHVPGWCDEESVNTAKEIAIALIKTMVTCWIEEAGSRA